MQPPWHPLHAAKPNMTSPTANADAPQHAATHAPARNRILQLTRTHALVASLWALGLMLTLPFLAPFKAPPIPSFHPEAIAAAFGLLALSVLPWFATRVELPRIALLPLAMTVLIVVQLAAGKLVFHQVG